MSFFSSVSLSEKGLIVPEYIAWDFIFSDSVLDAIRSKNKRKLLRKTDTLLQDNGIEQRIDRIKTKEHFLFLLDFFRSTHSEKEHEFVLNEQWFENKVKQGRTPESLELWRSDELVGMKMYSYDTEGFYLSHKASKRTYDQLIDIGLILDYLSFLRAQNLGYRVCKTGKGKNLFGVHLQLSLYEYKVSLGLHMHIAKDSPMPKLFFNDDPPPTPFVVYCIVDDQHKLFFVHAQESPVENLQKYSAVNMEIEAISYSQLCALQR